MSGRPDRTGLFAPLRIAFDSREIVYTLARQRLVRRFRGSILGVVWLLLAPAITLALYTLVFGVMLKSRWRVEDDGTAEYALMLYLGLCLFWFFSEILNEAPSLILNHATYVKKVVFPTECLLWVLVAHGLFLSALRVAIFLAACLWMQGSLPPTALALPLVWIPLSLYAAGIGWLLASVGAVLRDVGEIVALALMGLFFMSPVLYPIEMIPSSVHWLVAINPLTIPVEQARELAYFGTVPDPMEWLIQLGASLLVARLGLWLFNRSKRVFGDVV